MTTKSLRERLLEDDPVSHEPPLDAAAVDRIRRHVLAAGTGSRRLSLASLLARSAASAIVIVIAVLVFGLREADRGAGADRRGERIETPAEPAVGPASTAPAGQPAAPDAARVAASAAAPAARPAPSPAVEPRVVTIAAPAAVPAVSRARLRQLQFTTAGGTRLIWLFDPDVDAEVTP